MPLDVLIATPSGPFGELIRLTLEANPDFHCAILDNCTEIRSTLQGELFQAVIFDCSFIQPDPRQLIAQIKEEYPSLALLLVPPENRVDMTPLQNYQADGLITRPFDAAVLPDLVKSIIQKKENQPTPIKMAEPDRKPVSWWSAFQAGIRETDASSGMMVQNGLVIACTPDTGTALQQQVSASVMRFWNPDDAADLMRYIKDLVTGQEWMMYASRAAENAVLVLLFLPQTPVTRVRTQTLKLAKEIALLMKNPPVEPAHRDAGYLESAEPPRLHEILGEKTNEESPRIIKNGFPVEWFKEADLPEFNTRDQINEETPIFPTEEKATTFEEIASFEHSDSIEKSPAPVKEPEQPVEAAFPSEEDLSFIAHPGQITPEAVKDADLLLTNLEKSLIPESEESTSTNNLDLGNIQPVNLQPEFSEGNGLDSIQPIQLETKKAEYLQEIGSTENLPERDNEAAQILHIEATQPIPGESQESVPDVEPGQEFQPYEPFESSSLAVNEIQGTQTTSSEPAPELPEAPMIIPDFENQISSTGLTETNKEEEQPAIISESELAFLEQRAEEPAPTSEQIGLSEKLKNNIPTGSILDEEQAYISSVMPPDQTAIESPITTGDDLFTRMNQLESADKAEDSETCTVALIPRSENAILQRQIAGLLNQTMTRLCLAFNWKLDNLTIRPTYMQWTVTLPVSLSPEDMIGIVRKETSQEIRKAAIDNQMSGNQEDFWASESMSFTGKDFIPSNRWQDFILRRKNHEIA